MPMKKFVFTLLACGIAAISIAQPIFMGKNGQISFFSKTPLENIDATSEQLTVILNSITRDLVFSVRISSFKFDKDLMQEHFNEKYMESDKFPEATFKGKINEEVDLSKDGTYDITATGVLKIHGVEKPRTEKGTIIVRSGQIIVNSAFKVKCVDHNIEIPKLVASNIAESLDVKLNSTLTPFKKK